MMVTRWAAPTLAPSAAQRGIRFERASLTEIDRGSSLTRSARRFAARCHARQRRQSDGAPFIEHPLEVAQLLRKAGCSDVIVAAGLLHDVIEDTGVTPAELAARFGSHLANLVQAVSDDAKIHSYRERKRVLRQQVRSAGTDAALLFCADKIAKVRELRELPEGPEHPDSSDRADRHRRQLQLEHYHESLAMLQQVAPRHSLVRDLARELDKCPTPAGR